ncbi:MAG: bifunctional diguanylate cyclase/phosphodiesterase [Pseudomonadota bacterium]
MRQLTHCYHSKDALISFINQHQLASKQGLIQVFSGLSADAAASVSAQLSRLAPGFELIGASTCGELLAGKCYSRQLMIHFAVFEKQSTVELFRINRSAARPIDELLSNCSTREPRLAIIFADTLTSDPEDSLQQFARVFPQCKVVGGVVAASGQFSSPYLMLKQQIKDNGLVGALLGGDDLTAEITSFGGWRPIGKEFTVTKAHGNQVYSLDNVPILDIYQHYLGEYAQQLLPKAAAEFPLLLRNRSLPVLRTAIGLTDCQQGIVFAGTVKTGDKVSFSFADMSHTLHQTPEFSAQQGVCTLNYSCAARHSFLKGRINEEVERVTTNTKGAGGFFYGQLGTSCNKPQLLNLTSTVLQIAEKPLTNTQRPCSDKQRSLPNAAQALASLATQASIEYEAMLSAIRQHHSAVDASSIISITDAKGIIHYVNQKFEQISGYSSRELLGNTHRLIRHPKMADKVFEQLWQTISQKQPWYGLIRNQRKDGASYYVKTAIYPITDAHGEIKEYVSVRNDVTDIVKARRSIQKQNTDSLTQLPNRARLSRDLEQTEVHSVAVFDLKNFKLLNDYWGIEHGDKLIQALAQPLKTLCMSKALKLYHLNGAVFAIKPNQPINFFSFRIIIADIRAKLEAEDLTVDEHDHEINFSVGIGASKNRALAYAESAIIEAKRDNVNASMVTRTQDSETDNFYFWLAEIKQAFKESRVIAYFQEITPIRSASQTPKKYEALARIRLTNGDIASPHAFLHFLKKTKHYKTLTQLMVAAAIAQSKQSGCFISVNLSIQDVLDKHTTDYIMSVLETEHQARIIFEITESEAIQDFTAIKHFMSAVRALGALIAIDDFGSGYSNFIYLVEIKPDFIKIDGSIIKTIKHNPNSRHVAQSIIDLAQGLGIQTVAEFVSDQQTFELLKQMGAEHVQGFYIGKPMADVSQVPAL